MSHSKSQSQSQSQSNPPVELTPIVPPLSLATVAPNAPVTKERNVRSDLEDYIQKPYLARALVAPSIEHPNGTPGRESKGLSVLQQHVSFFDQNKDGIVYPWETYRGLRNLGFGIIQSLFAAIVINLGLSYVTLSGWIPNPCFPIYVERIHKAKHGSSSGTFDNEGRFMPMNLENIFTKFGKTMPDKLSEEEIQIMRHHNRNSYDFLGWIISKGEWKLLYAIGADEDGYLSKEVVRGVFDGSLFERVAELRKKGKRKTF